MFTIQLKQLCSYSKEIVDVLEPARVATESLSSSNINLLIGEGIMKFLMTESQAVKTRHGSFLGQNFCDALDKYFKYFNNVFKQS
jgi:hypothetical protein